MVEEQCMASTSDTEGSGSFALKGIGHRAQCVFRLTAWQPKSLPTSSDSFAAAGNVGHGAALTRMHETSHTRLSDAVLRGNTKLICGMHAMLHLWLQAAQNLLHTALWPCMKQMHTAHIYCVVFEALTEGSARSLVGNTIGARCEGVLKSQKGPKSKGKQESTWMSFSKSPTRCSTET
jgi:hypothetical protein